MIHGFAFLLCALATGVVYAAPMRLGSFSWRATLTLDGKGPFYQVALPLAVYEGVTRADMGDLRVFNGKGDIVPHALFNGHASAPSETTESSVPVFPIIGNKGKDGAMSVDVRRTGDDTLVAVHQGRAADVAPILGAVLDLSRTAGQVNLLRLKLGATKTPFIPFKLESSDDLQSWRVLRDDGQLAVMEHEGHRIDNTTIPLDCTAGKYLRIVWGDPDNAPSIQEAIVTATRSSHAPRPIVWTGAYRPQSSTAPDFDYTLPGQLPLQRLRIGLPERNSLVSITVQYGLVDERQVGMRERWITLNQSTVYRLDGKHAELVSPDIILNHEPVHRLRLSLDNSAGGVGAEAPLLMLGFTPSVLVFLGRGDGPFSLGWGHVAAPDIALDADSLIPGYRTDREFIASQAAIENIVHSAVATGPATTNAAPGPASKRVLWAVLVAGVLLLGTMAAVLLKQLKSAER